MLADRMRMRESKKGGTVTLIDHKEGNSPSDIGYVDIELTYEDGSTLSIKYTDTFGAGKTYYNVKTISFNTYSTADSDDWCAWWGWAEVYGDNGLIVSGNSYTVIELEGGDFTFYISTGQDYYCWL